METSKDGNKLSWFAPAGRADQATVEKQCQYFAENPLLFETLQTISAPVLILNDKRQLVFANHAFLHISGAKDLKDILGFRAGEALGCIYSDLMEKGCGTSEYCTECGAVRSILAGIEGIEDVQECSISRGKDADDLNLRVTASPMEVEGEVFVVFSATDIADEKRREVLERLFLHDVKNTVGGIYGLSRLLGNVPEEEKDRYLKLIEELSETLLEEISFYSQLVVAESGKLEPKIAPVNPEDMLQKVKELYLNHSVGKDKLIEIRVVEFQGEFNSDESLLVRIIGNMCKNALEAIRSGGTVTLSCEQEGDNIRFSVHNPGVIPPETRLQIFQRSFSTKGSGRGIGTYSIKLLSEQYLRGKVGFTSSPEEGTTFYGSYPLEYANA